MLGRLAKLDINREVDAAYRLCRAKDRLTKDVEEVIEDEKDVSARESTNGKWAELAKLVGRLRAATPGQGAKECRGSN